MPQSNVAEIFLSRASPEEYIKTLGFSPYPWQLKVLSPHWTRMLLNCARQSGKSTVTAAIAWHAAKTTRDGLVLVFAPTERQSIELNVKLMDFAQRDGELSYVSGAKNEKKLKNGCRLFALPGTEKSIRGFSDPTMIIIDEAARTDDLLYRSVRPMMLTGNTKLIGMSTPFGREGWFWEEWDTNPTFEKVLVKAPVAIIDGQVRKVEETEAHFAERMKRKGIDGFYSPRRSLKVMKEEWLSMPEWWYRQEYLGEFMEAQAAVFTQRDIDKAMSLDSSEFLNVHEEMLDDEVNIIAGMWD